MVRFTPRFCLTLFLVIGGVFSASVTLVTAKNQHRCWKARVYTRARDRGLDVDKQSEDSRRKGYEKTEI